MSDELTLPELRSTEEAMAFGRQLTPVHYVFLNGARAALEREFCQTPETSIQRRADLAFQIQLLREAIEAAPPEVTRS